MVIRSNPITPLKGIKCCIKYQLLASIAKEITRGWIGRGWSWEKEQSKQLWRHHEYGERIVEREVSQTLEHEDTWEDEKIWYVLSSNDGNDHGHYSLNPPCIEMIYKSFAFNWAKHNVKWLHLSTPLRRMQVITFQLKLSTIPCLIAWWRWTLRFEFSIHLQVSNIEY